MKRLYSSARTLFKWGLKQSSWSVAAQALQPQGCNSIATAPVKQLHVRAQARGKRSRKWAPPRKGEIGLYREKFLPLAPDWSIFMQMRTPINNLIGPKSLSWLVAMEPFWLISKDANEDVIVQPQLDRKSQFYWSKYDSRNSFIRVCLDSRSTMQKAWLPSLCLLAEILRAWEATYTMAARLWL